MAIRLVGRSEGQRSLQQNESCYRRFWKEVTDSGGSLPLEPKEVQSERLRSIRCESRAKTKLNQKRA